MSAAPREKTSWLATSYEKLILDVALIVLAALCILLALNLIGGDAASSVRGSGVAQQEGITATEMDPAVWVEKDAAMRSPFQMTIQSNLMLVSQLRVYCVNPACEKPIAFNAAKCPFCQAAQPSREDIAGMDYDGDGMPDQFEKKFGLNPYDPGDAALDLDGDGFSNVEEFQNKTDPTDPEDHPSPAAKLRMVRMVVKPFFLRFQGVSELATGKSFLLNLRSADKSHFAKLGAVVEGYKVAAYDEASSILTLEKDGKSLQLKKNEPITAKEFIAALVSLLDGRQYQVRMNDAIDVKGRPHKVIDINPSHVLIEDEQTQKQIQVPPLTEEERMILRGISEPSAMQAEPGAVESAAAQFPPPAEP
ncbi:MAG TPA: thrombospondin type 3 repeat-containing protein [Kiritimatiellia bacterium]|nr:thrombospondin type 3 repeat-containing protein [Kiritimatiellia bacterium]